MVKIAILSPKTPKIALLGGTATSIGLFIYIKTSTKNTTWKRKVWACLFKSTIRKRSNPGIIKSSSLLMMCLFIFGRDGSTLVEYNIYMKITFVKGRASYANMNNLRTVEAMKKVINGLPRIFRTNERTNGDENNSPSREI